MQITLAQREALDVVVDMIDKSNTAIPEYGTKIMTLILGILNVDSRAEHTITQIDNDKITPITNPNNGNDGIQINMPDWIKTMPTPPFVPGDKRSEPAPWEQRIWYNRETEPFNAQEGAEMTQERRYTTNITCTGDKNGTFSVSHTNGKNDIEDTITTAEVFRQNTGDFRDEREQSTFKDK